jgi:hypothetical protein
VTALVLQAVAAVAGLALAASVVLGKLGQRKPPVPLPSFAPSLVSQVPQTSLNQDMHTVLSLADRLKAVGCDKGVELAKQLLDTMLAHREGRA